MLKLSVANYWASFANSCQRFTQLVVNINIYNKKTAHNNYMQESDNSCNL